RRHAMACRRPRVPDRCGVVTLRFHGERPDGRHTSCLGSGVGAGTAGHATGTMACHPTGDLAVRVLRRRCGGIQTEQRAACDSDATAVGHSWTVLQTTRSQYCLRINCDACSFRPAVRLLGLAALDSLRQSAVSVLRRLDRADASVVGRTPMIRFLPDTWRDAILRPLALASPDGGVYIEIIAPDFRFLFIL